MASLTNPADYSVRELEDSLGEIDDPEQLDAILDAEQNGKDRKTAKEAIKRRLDAITDTGHDGSAPAEEGTTDDPNAPDDDPDREVETESVEGNGQADNEGPRGRDADDAGGLDSVDPAAKRAEVLEGLDPDEELRYRLLDDLDAFRGALENATNDGSRFEAKIRQLQSDVDDLQAYTHALEEFLDEEGTGRQVIESLRSDQEAIEKDLRSVKTAVNQHAQNLGDVWGVLADIEDGLSDQEQRIKEQRRRLEALADDVDEEFHTVQETLDNTADEVDEVEAQVSTLADDLDAVAENLDGLDQKVEAQGTEAANRREELATRIGENADGIDELRETTGELAGLIETHEDVLGESGRIERRFQELEEGLNSLESWRKQLGTVLSGPGDEAAAPASDE